ncbi:MAG: hypothetical protein ACXWMB_05320, partial [Candidatus Limnocylindria bacterium]
RKREEREEAACEADRRALFEELAKRPESVCPFLGLASARAGYRPEANGEHRCYAFGDPAPLSDEQQRHVCLERGYSNCPRYLRGVLVIPTEELEALRRPQPAAPPPPPPPVRSARSGGGRGWLLVPLLLVLIAAAGAGGWYLLNYGPGLAILPSDSPTPSPNVEPSAPASALPSVEASGIETATPLVTPTPLPTPTAGDVFVGYEVGVGPETYTIYQVDDQGNLAQSKGATFSRFSHASVEPVDAPNGTHYWRTLDGGYIGWSYIAGRSGDFQIRKVYRAPDGSRRAIILPDDQL